MSFAPVEGMKGNMTMKNADLSEAGIGPDRDIFGSKSFSNDLQSMAERHSVNMKKSNSLFKQSAAFFAK